MSWEKKEFINRIEILGSGELLLGIEGEGKAMYQYVYREAAGVYWDPVLKGFKSTELKSWTPSQWYFHMIDIVRMGLGVTLIRRDSIHWNRLTDEEKAIILNSNP